MTMAAETTPALTMPPMRSSLRVGRRRRLSDNNNELGLKLGILIPLVLIVVVGFAARYCAQKKQSQKVPKDSPEQSGNVENNRRRKLPPKQRQNLRGHDTEQPVERQQSSNDAAQKHAASRNKSKKTNKSGPTNGRRDKPRKESKLAARGSDPPGESPIMGKKKKATKSTGNPELQEFEEQLSLHSHDEGDDNNNWAHFPKNDDDPKNQFDSESNSDSESDSSSSSSSTVNSQTSLEAFSDVKHDPNAAKLYQHHLRGNWRAIRDFYSTIRRRIIERQHYNNLLVSWIAAEWPGPIQEDTTFCKYLDEWKKDDPFDLQCSVIRLEVWIAWAWHGRTNAFAHKIPPQRVALFYDRMDSAAAELQRVLRNIKKRDALVYAAAIKIAMGRNESSKVAQEYMQAVQQSNDPANYMFHTRAMEYFSEKWHGSNREMMDYANWITSQLPDGHPLWILIPVSRYERATLIQSPSARRKYWIDQKESIVEAYEKALGGIWETTINKDITPACMKLDSVVRNWFLYALGKCRANDLARRQARVIGKHPLADLPWDENYTYAQHVKSLGLNIDSDDWE